LPVVFIIIDEIKKQYGINYRYEETQGGGRFVNDFSKADSAMLLLEVYRKQLRRDPKTGNWIITR
jgi:hypothetical protein